LSAGDLCQPSGPDGEGQATGQARNARGETSAAITEDGNDRAAGAIHAANRDVPSAPAGSARIAAVHVWTRPRAAIKLPSYITAGST
jgi:hypothetical protein